MKHFLMSTRFNKQKPSDFGLEYVDGKYVSVKDGTEWVPCQLYDYGWGKENGFYKKPLATFSDLIRLIFDSSDDEDLHGAAAIIEDVYPNELKIYLLDLMNQQISRKTKRRVCILFKLDFPINKTYNNEYSFEQNNYEYQQWKKISEFYSEK